MSLGFLAPIEHHGRLFDRGSILFEFQALREPEATQFPQIGEYVKARCPMVEIPTPSMLWRGKLWPDLYIANQLEALKGEYFVNFPASEPRLNKSKWYNDIPLEGVSRSQHGDQFHETFIEPMCRKIAGRSSAEIAAKYHRAIWLPLWWPQTLRARASIRTPFYYPAVGYAGAVARGLGEVENSGPRNGGTNSYDSTEVSIAYAVAAPRQAFSVVFVVDESPIYRVTDMDACASIECAAHRLIVEYRGECDVPAELARLNLADVAQIAYGSMRLSLPTLANVAAGWEPRPHINAQLWGHINAETLP